MLFPNLVLSFSAALIVVEMETWESCSGQKREAAGEHWEWCPKRLLKRPVGTAWLEMGWG